MTAKLHVVCAAAAAALGLSGCLPVIFLGRGVLPVGVHPKSIAGEYRLAAVNGHELPWTGLGEATGRPVTFVSGTLRLAQAVPDVYDSAGGGVLLARHCVRQIPEGGGVDSDGVVHDPNGATYALPGCGNGQYELVITRSDPEGSDSTAGRYTWGTAASDPLASYITLLGSMSGEVIGSRIVSIRLQHAGSADPNRPLYEFVPTRW